jgi:hypothetical protein
MAYFDDQEIETVPSPQITTETAATTTSITATAAAVNIDVPIFIIIKSLFALAVFLSLSLNPNPVPSNTLSSDPACAPTHDTAVSLVTDQFNALTSFIFSAITAFGVRIATQHDDVNNIKGFFRFIMVVSDIAFFLGVGFLLFAISDLAEMKLGLGTFSCGSSSATLAAVVPLAISAPLSLLFFLYSIMSASMRT